MLVAALFLLPLTAGADRSGPFDPGGTFTDEDDSAHEGAIEAIAAIGVTKGDFCIPPPPPDLDCGDIPQKNFTVLPPDPHNFDGDNDGIGRET